jgi:hypothetical protein
MSETLEQSRAEKLCHSFSFETSRRYFRGSISCGWRHRFLETVYDCNEGMDARIRDINALPGIQMLTERIFRIRRDCDNLKAGHNSRCHCVSSIISQDTQIASVRAATTPTRVLASRLALSQESHEGLQVHPAIILQMTIQFTAKKTAVVRLKSVSHLSQRNAGDGNQFFSALFVANTCARIEMSRLMHYAFVSTKAEMRPCQAT